MILHSPTFTYMSNIFSSQMVKMLLEKGATINAFDKKDRRAIHWAAYMGHVDVVKILTDHGAEINCRDKQVWITFQILYTECHCPSAKASKPRMRYITELGITRFQTFLLKPILIPGMDSVYVLVYSGMLDK